jgi:hypothetical protein
MRSWAQNQEIEWPFLWLARESHVDKIEKHQGTVIGGERPDLLLTKLRNRTFGLPGTTLFAQASGSLRKMSIDADSIGALRDDIYRTIGEFENTDGDIHWIDRKAR